MFFFYETGEVAPYWNFIKKVETRKHKYNRSGIVKTRIE